MRTNTKLIRDVNKEIKEKDEIIITRRLLNKNIIILYRTKKDKLIIIKCKILL